MINFMSLALAFFITFTVPFISINQWKTEKMNDDPIVTEETISPTIEERVTETTTINETIETQAEEESTTDVFTELTPEDKLKAMQYVAKLDMTYVMSLTIDGYNEKNIELVKEHMKERLTSEEYNEAETLLIKYLFLPE